MAGQVWASLDENGLAGALRAVVVGVEVWASNLRMSIGGAWHAHARIAAEPVLKAQARTNEEAAQGQNLLPAPAAEEEGEIVVSATDEG